MTNNDSFIEDDYEVPRDSGEFIKLEAGTTTTVRILERPIKGYQAWKDGEDDKREVVRKKTKEEVKELIPNEKPEHFWGMKVYNQDEGIVQTLTITQSTIQKELVRLYRNKKWGNPIGTDGYDIAIEREGEGQFNTKYTTTPNPKEPLSKEAMDVIEATPYDLNFLLEGKYPIGDSEEDELDF